MSGAGSLDDLGADLRSKAPSVPPQPADASLPSSDVDPEARGPGWSAVSRRSLPLCPRAGAAGFPRAAHRRDGLAPRRGRSAHAGIPRGVGPPRSPVLGVTRVKGLGEGGLQGSGEWRGNTCKRLRGRVLRGDWPGGPAEPGRGWAWAALEASSSSLREGACWSGPWLGVGPEMVSVEAQVGGSSQPLPPVRSSADTPM